MSALFIVQTGIFFDISKTGAAPGGAAPVSCTGIARMEET
jgi:hypothetical protein